MKVYTEQEIVQILNHIRSDLHEPYHKVDGRNVPVPPLDAMKIAIDRVFDAFGLDSDDQPVDEIEQLKQRIAKLERERAYVPMPYPVYPTNPMPTYPLSPAICGEYRIWCSGNTITHVERLNENC